VGARITLEAGGIVQTREVILGDGYGSQNTLRQHFGLDDATSVNVLRVKWPRSGTTDVFRDVPIDRLVTVTEGDSRLGISR
jgi:hypothetical protein